MAIEVELVLSHQLGGGTEVFLEEYLQAHQDYKRYVIRPDIAAASMPEWNTLIQKYGITHIMVNHLFGFPLYETMDCIRELQIPYTVYLHDFFCLCLNTSMNCQALYCNEYRENEYCRYIFRSAGMEQINLVEYREKFQRFLSGADRLIAPTGYAAGIIQSAYKDLSIQIRPHKLSCSIERTYRHRFAQEPVLTFAFLGTFCGLKGARYILDLNQWVRLQQLPVRFVVIGDDAAEDIDTGSREGLLFHGAYEREDVAALLAESHAAAVLLPSTFPETYCYTASEAILAGYPVLSMNMGAHALRIQRADCGWVLDRNVPDRGQGALRAWLRQRLTPTGRQEMTVKADHTRNFKNGME